MPMKPEGPQAIPSWLNGHAYLSLGEGMIDVIDPHSGQVVRRVPRGGAAEVEVAVTAAQEAMQVWAALPLSARQRHLAALADAVLGMAGHLAGLLADDNACTPQAAAAEIEAALAALAEGAVNGEATGPVLAVVGEARPLFTLIAAVAPLLLAGRSVVVRPAPRTCGSAYALCELSARAGWPPGVLNLIQGDESTVALLCQRPEIALVVDAGADDPAGLRAAAEAGGKCLISGGWK